MSLILCALAIWIISGLLAAATAATPRRATGLGSAGAVLGALCCMGAALPVLISGQYETLFMPWSIPGAAFHLGLDALSAFFLAPIAGLGALCAVYAIGYLEGEKHAERIGTGWLCYNLLLASMALVVLARNALLFLMAWETMALASFFLVLFDHHKAPVRLAAWIYMIATHMGAAFLVALFVLLGRNAGSFEFSDFLRSSAHLPAATAGMLFLFAVIGFGSKAGLLPMHVWLPEAHPAAPSHVSALMSGVMIKTGVYGLIRILTFLGPPPAEWGALLILIGALSGIFGVLLALMQSDLKRLLAYSSVENIGIIVMGLGLGYLGMACDRPGVAVLGFAGALLHLWNHAAFKGLLFLGAGAIRHSTGTGAMDRLGGLMKKMPLTGLFFCIGAAAISGLPPLNGFISEFLVYFSAFQGVVTRPGIVVIGAILVIAALALIGGLAAACFTKAAGMIFLGEPRSTAVDSVHEVSRWMLAPMATAAGICIALGLSAPKLFHYLAPVIEITANGKEGVGYANLHMATTPLSWIIQAGVLLVILTALLAGIRHVLLRSRKIALSDTWDCGYAEPTARMQYTSVSYAQPFTAVFTSLLPMRREGMKPQGVLPGPIAFTITSFDLFLDRFYRPCFRYSSFALDYLRRAQHGHVQLYVLCIAMTLIILLLVALG